MFVYLCTFQLAVSVGGRLSTNKFLCNSCSFFRGTASSYTNFTLSLPIVERGGVQRSTNNY